MRNYKQVDTETTEEEKVKIIDVIAVAVAIFGVTLFIWSVI